MVEDFFKTFASDYDTIFLVDLETNQMSVTQCKPDLEETFTSLSKDGYNEYREKFCDKYIFPEDRDWIISKTNPDSIQKSLTEDGVFIINYKLKTSDGRTLFYQTKITPLDDTSEMPTKVIIGGHSMNDAEREAINVYADLYSAKHNAVIASLATDFDYICYINMETQHVHRYYASEIFKNVLNGIDTNLHTYQRLQALFQAIIYKEDYEQFKKDIEAAKVVRELNSLPSYEIYFRASISDQIFYYKLRLVRDDNSKDGVILGLQSFDEQIRTRIQHREQEKAHALMEKQMEKLLRERTVEIREKNQILNRINEDIIEMLGDVTEARDLESGEHIRRVKTFTSILANQIMIDWPEYGLDKNQIDLISSASALHDIGKIVIPDSILLKPGKLTPEEFEIMKTHTTKGCELLKKAPKDWSPAYLETSMEICHFHHEKYDGKGYPLGLKGEEIPLSAQIVSIADCYDALSSKRVYKEAFSSDTAYKMILEGKCGTFNPKLIDSFRRCIARFEKQDFEANHVEYGISGHVRENLNGKMILYVEDEEISRTIGREMLEGEGAITVEAKSGKEAISIFQATSKGAFDAIIMDLFMPEMTGVEAVKIIRSMENEYAKEIPIVALTASSDRDDLNMCLENGMNAYLTKPVSVKNLRSVLLRLINKE